jgi:outer membrane lipase/esterase
VIRTTFGALAAASAIGVAEAPAATIADTYSSFWVFGDSLSDTGNVATILPGFPPPPYYRNRLSNGPVWAEEFLDDFGSGRSGNFAVAGARVDSGPLPDFDLQLDAFQFAPKTLGDRPLAAVWFGANDMFDTIAAAGADPANAASIVASGISGVIGSLSSGVTRILQSGVGSVALFNLPDLGATPRLAAEGPEAQAAGSDVIDAFNAALGQFATGLSAQGVEVIGIDVAALFDAATADSAAFGLTNVTDACLPVDPFSILTGTPVPPPCATPESYLFWDVLHPSATGTRGHRRGLRRRGAVAGAAARRAPASRLRARAPRPSPPRGLRRTRAHSPRAPAFPSGSRTTHGLSRRGTPKGPRGAP